MRFEYFFTFLAVAYASIEFSAAAFAETPEIMMAECRARAGKEFQTRLPNIETKYEGERTDHTHAVNGTAWFSGRTETFQCSFDSSGSRIIRFVVNKPTDAAVTDPQASADKLVPGTTFNATGNINCARFAGQPLGSCRFGVVREGNGNGSITVFWPDGGNRVIYFEDGTPVRYDESQADGGARMAVGQNADLFTVTIGEQRFEIPDAVISGG